MPQPPPFGRGTPARHMSHDPVPAAPHGEGANDQDHQGGQHGREGFVPPTCLAGKGDLGEVGDGREGEDG